jgi:hypothetical protein
MGMKLVLRTDIIILSKQTKTLIAVDLNVSWEDHCSEAHERKSNKYADLMADRRDKGWKAILFPVDVWCRGFPAQAV